MELTDEQRKKIREMEHDLIDIVLKKLRTLQLNRLEESELLEDLGAHLASYGIIARPYEERAKAEKMVHTMLAHHVEWMGDLKRKLACAD